MNKKVAAIAAVIIIIIVGVFAYAQKSDNKPSTSENTSSEKIKVVHSLGETDVAKNPEKVVVFDIPTLDTMNALGIESVVGVPSSIYPENLKKYESDEYVNVGTLKEIDMEAIKSAQPDLIIIGGRQADYYEELSKIAPTISMSKDNTKYYEDSVKNIKLIAEIFGCEDEVNKKLEEIDSKIAKTKEKVNGAEALTLMVNEGNLSVYSDNSRFALAYQNLGFVTADDTIEDSTHGQNISFEYLAKVNPEYILVIDRNMATSGESAAKAVLDNDIVKSTDAYKNGKIIYLDAYTWYINDAGLDSINIMIDDIYSNIK